MKFVEPFVMTNVMREDEAKLQAQIDRYADYVTKPLVELDDLG